MSLGPDLELQDALVPALKADAELSKLIAGRIYDQPPQSKKGPQFPYVTLGEAQVIRDDALCVEGQIVYLTLHAWSVAAGFPEVKQVAAAVVECLHMAPLTLASFRLVSLMHRQNRIFRDADGTTSHAVIEFVANTEKLTG